MPRRPAASGLPLRDRKRLLRGLGPAAGPLRYSEHFEGAGEELYERVRELGLEGIVAKRAEAPYQGGRSEDWVKVHAPRTGTFAVVGFTRPSGSRAGFGALHLAAIEPDPRGGPPGLSYAGKVGTGFTEERLRDLRRRLEARRRASPAFEGPAPRGRGNVWVEPGLLCRVRYKERTEEGRLRAPVFVDLEEATLEPSREVAISNPEKVFWPAEGHTKGDLIAYYRDVAPRILPFLRDRPVVLTRYPDGIGGKHFFQKDAPDFAPDWIRTEIVWSEGAAREISYFIVNDLPSLLYLVNLATIPLHVWASRVPDLDRPDWCVLDLDPKQAPFDDVIALALETGRLCREIGLPAYVKTSGSTGLHILVPLGGLLDHDRARTLGELLARVVQSRRPQISTLVRDPAKREGKVYLDYVQNGHGRLLVAPYSVRARPGAPVSTPLRWEEVGPDLDPRAFTITTVPSRLERLGDDPMGPVLEQMPDLAAALERLRDLLGG